MKDIGIIGSADGPTAVYVSASDENFWQSGGVVEENIMGENTESISENNVDNEEILVDSSINEILDSKTLSENLNAGLKIMGIGMVAVFGVLTILYIVIKIMGHFAKQKKDNSNEKN